jgi:putative ABC transport system ATP-binding protein
VYGPSGSGKSLLLGILAGLVPVDAGSVCVGGKSLSNLSESQRREWRGRSLGLLLQGENLLPGLTTFENVMLGLRFRQAYPRLQWRSRAHEMLARVGLGHCRRRMPGSLSPVDRQKVALARAMVHHPTLLLLDEPTARLDPGSSNQWIELLREMAREGGQTVVLFTNDRALAGRLDPVVDASQLIERSDQHP